MSGTADDAWSEALTQVKRIGYMGTPAFSHQSILTAIARRGSCRHFCEILPADGPELVGWRKLFESTYRTPSVRAGDRLDRAPWIDHEPRDNSDGFPE